jgi:thiol-disulfide isomerase/thioredoxin
MNNILVIGVVSSCPRCKLLENIIDAKVEELNVNAKVNHLAYTNPEARRIANSFGLIPGTAKDVSGKIEVPIESKKISMAKNSRTIHPDYDFRAYNNCNWTYELDEVLRPFENQAKEVGIMMTPALIINGELKHQGSVPCLSKIDEWLLDLKKYDLVF